MLLALQDAGAGAGYLMSRHELLVLVALPDSTIEALRERYTLHFAVSKGWEAAGGFDAGRIRGVVTNGSTGLSAGQMALFPNLEIISALGAGIENVDAREAARRGIEVTNSAGANAETVADHALGLMLALARDIVSVDARVRAGEWHSARAARPTLNGARLGILGLGRIGEAIARRAVAFGMGIAYCNRQARPNSDYDYHANPVALADAVDFLVISCPGGVATRHIVEARVLKALGPKGYLVNVSRGSTVDTSALTGALQAGGIGGAALDVIDGEPSVPAALVNLRNVIFTPHIAGRSFASQRAQQQALLTALSTRFERNASLRSA
jgi:D-3-phosphoglycerate dehydrogenase